MRLFYSVEVQRSDKFMHDVKQIVVNFSLENEFRLMIYLVLPAEPLSYIGVELIIVNYFLVEYVSE